MAIGLLEVDDVIQVIIESEVAGQVVLNTTYYRCSVAPSAGDTYGEQITTFLTAITAHTPGPSIVQAMLNMMAPNAIIRSATAQRIRPVRSPYIRTLVGEFGQAEDPEAAPPNVCLSITKRTEATGRGRSGHWQQAGIPTANFSDGYWLAAFVADEGQELADELEAVIELTTGGTFVPGIQPAGTVGGFEDLMTCEPKEEIRTMHRRTVGLGI